MHILPIASGKGGVGKSVIAANLSLAIAEAGKRVVLADLDLGGSNIHTILGLRSVERGLGTFLSGRKLKFDDILIQTGYDGLKFIPGDAEIPEIADLKSYQMKRLIRNLTSLDTDYLILDLGAGTHRNALDFFLISGRGIIVTNPTLTAILNAYLFLKNSVFRLMGSAFPKQSPASRYILSLKKEGRLLQRIYIPQLLSKIKEEDRDSYDAFTVLEKKFRPTLILNMIDDPDDAEKIEKLRRSTREYLNVELEHLGIIYRDDLQDIALSSRLPIIKYKPDSIISQAIYRIADKILQKEGETEDTLEITTPEESYQVAEMEAETDFQVRMQNLEELLHFGTLTTGDLVETIRSQHFELQHLKKENQLLKTKLVRAASDGFKV
ncbi:MAG: MinD/ParA family protein [Spirochaetes bacterium]|nr:MinD/ParA family protein [Spirochaetota bacterium]